MANRLANEASPYLLQHAGNPVDWYPWGEEALARARTENRPILLSIGYSACHWCHVMAHESFEDPDTARLMNELFVNIKVDREERPDLDTIYMQAVQAMTGRGGWPMTVFLTPRGVPFYGGTYFPPEERHGMRSFRFVLEAAAAAYRDRPDDIAQVEAEMERAMTVPALTRAEPVTQQALEEATLRLLDQLDWVGGGFGGAPKFPHATALDFLLQRWQRASDPRAWDAASVCLDRMARGGICDQLGGGFHRYSVDADWAVPHFEKMLYDNALLVPLYVRAHLLSGRRRWRRTAEATLDYMAAELLLPSGGFAASQDADSEAGEGAYFVWTPAQIAAVLGPDDAELACRVFGVTEAGNFEGGATVLSLPAPLDDLARDLNLTPEELESHVDGIRARLLQARGSRPAPQRDEKVVTAWNALAVAAFAGAGASLGRQDYLDVAVRCADFLLETVADAEGWPLRTWCRGRSGAGGFLEDFACLGDALLTLFEATGQSRHLAAAQRLAAELTPRFGDGAGGLYDTAANAAQLVVRPRTLDDSPTPSGPAVAARLLLRLSRLTGSEELHAHARAIVTPLAAAVARAPLAVATAATVLEWDLVPPLEVAVVGPAADRRTQRLVAEVWARFQPGMVLAWGDGVDLPLLEGRTLVGGAPAAYVCEHFTCDRPITDPDELRGRLENRAADTRP